MSQVELLPARLDVIAYQGDDVALPLAAFEDDEPIDLSDGWSGWAAQIREGYADDDDAPVVATLDIEVDDTTILLTLDRDTMTNVLEPEREYRWDLEVVDPDGVRCTLVRGTWRTDPETTRVETG